MMNNVTRLKITRIFLWVAAVFLLLMSATYIFLINFRNFPPLEYANAVLMSGLAFFLWLIYPWNLKPSDG
jgi:hypothetical protein